MSVKESTEKPKIKMEKVAIDSNIFRNLDFINYLRDHKAKIKIFLPTIVSLEIGYFHLAKGITWEEFKKEMQKFNGIFLEWDSIVLSEVLRNAIDNKSTLPFRHHFRDFLIGTQCEKLGVDLITYNKAHFKWLKTTTPLTPEDFIKNKIEKK